MGAGDNAAGAVVHALRRPLGALHGVAGAACKPRGGEVCIEDCDGVMVRWTVWWAYLEWRGGGRCRLEGFAELQVTV